MPLKITYLDLRFRCAAYFLVRPDEVRTYLNKSTCFILIRIAPSHLCLLAYRSLGEQRVYFFLFNLLYFFVSKVLLQLFHLVRGVFQNPSFQV